MTGELAAMDAIGQAELVRSGQASPAELVEAAIARVEALNPELNAVIHPLFDSAREEAASDVPDGPFRGVPFLLKDLGATLAGQPLHMGMRALKEAGFTAPTDTYLAQRFRAAGLITIGKTNTPEIGILPTTEPEAYGPTRNPWSLDRTPGGSSGGSAAAVAAGLVPMAHANDGGGSIRIPASCCGLVGLKPTRQRITEGPVVGDVMSGLTCDLVVSRSVRDTAAVLEAVRGPAPGDPYVAPEPARPYTQELGADPGRLRIGLMLDPPAAVELHPEARAGAEAAGRLLESLGHAVEPSGLGGGAKGAGEGIEETFRVRWAAGQAVTLRTLSAALGRELGESDMEPLTWELARRGRAASAEDYLWSVSVAQRLTRAIAAWYEQGNDLLLTPTMAETPPELGSFAQDPENPMAPFHRAIPMGAFTALFNITGQPAISLPLHWSADGLPVGVQLVAPYGREDLLLRVASQLEEAQPWAGRSPPAFALAV